MKQSNGSSLLVVLLVMSSLMILAMSVWRTIALSFDLSVQKQQYEQQFQLTRGLLNVAIGITKSYFDQIIRRLQFNKTVDLKFLSWPLHNNIRNYNGTIAFSFIKDNCLQLHACLNQKKNTVLEMQCAIQKAQDKEKKSYFKITEFTTKT